MPDIEDVLEDAQREIKSIGDNVKSLKDNPTPAAATTFGKKVNWIAIGA